MTIFLLPLTSMNPLLLENPVKIRTRVHRLVIESGDKTNEYEPSECPFNVIIVNHYLGYISFEALEFLSAHGIPIIFLNLQSKLQSLFLATQHSTLFGKVKLAQFKAYNDISKRQELSKAFLEARKTTCNNLLAFYNLEPVPFDSTEAVFAKLYFSRLSSLFRSSDFKFVSRKSPFQSRNWRAMSRVNCMLNYGYSILEAIVRKHLFAFGLESDIGFRHVSYESKESLVYDFQDVFRTYVERAVIDSVSKMRVKDFLHLGDYTYRITKPSSQILVDEIFSNIPDSLVYYSIRDFSRYLLGRVKTLDLLATRAQRIDSARNTPLL